MGRRQRVITVDGETHTLQEWADKQSISIETIKSRIKHGWSAYEVVGKTAHVPKDDGTIIEIDAMRSLNDRNQNDDGNGTQQMQRQSKFLDAYLECGKPTEAATQVGISHSTYYRWLNDDEIFREACDRIADWTTQKLRDKVMSMLELPDQYKALVQHPNILFFELKRRDPAYKDNFEVNIYNQQLSIGEQQQAIEAFWREEDRRLGTQKPKLISAPKVEVVDE